MCLLTHLRRETFPVMKAHRLTWSLYVLENCMVSEVTTSSNLSLRTNLLQF
jgi:hypothetical protein